MTHKWTTNILDDGDSKNVSRDACCRVPVYKDAETFLPAFSTNVIENISFEKKKRGNVACVPWHNAVVNQPGVRENLKRYRLGLIYNAP